MARIRTIKPEFWTDETLTECSLSARLMFIGMLNFADDNGNIERSSKQLKMRIFPADDINCEELVNELTAHGVLIEYSLSDKKYLHIKGFREHQVINRPSKSKIPEFDSNNTHGVLTEYSGTEGKGREGKGKRGAFALNESAWQEWLDYRKKRKLAKYASDKIKNQLCQLDYEKQQDCVNDSITQNYSGLFVKKFMPESAPLKSKTDGELLALAESLSIHTQGKNRFQLIGAIEAKR